MGSSRPASARTPRGERPPSSELAAALEEFGLQQYARPLAELGYSTVSSMLRAPATKWDGIIASLRPLPGHTVRLVNAVEELRAKRIALSAHHGGRAQPVSAAPPHAAHSLSKSPSPTSSGAHAGVKAKAGTGRASQIARAYAKPPNKPRTRRSGPSTKPPRPREHPSGLPRVPFAHAAAAVMGSAREAHAHAQPSLGAHHPHGLVDGEAAVLAHLAARHALEAQLRVLAPQPYHRVQLPPGAGLPPPSAEEDSAELDGLGSLTRLGMLTPLSEEPGEEDGSAADSGAEEERDARPKQSPQPRTLPEPARTNERAHSTAERGPDDTAAATETAVGGDATAAPAPSAAVEAAPAASDAPALARQPGAHARDASDASEPDSPASSSSPRPEASASPDLSVRAPSRSRSARSAMAAGFLANSFDGGRLLEAEAKGSIARPNAAETFRCVSLVLHKHICDGADAMLLLSAGGSHTPSAGPSSMGSTAAHTPNGSAPQSGAGSATVSDSSDDEGSDYGSFYSDGFESEELPDSEEEEGEDEVGAAREAHGAGRARAERARAGSPAVRQHADELSRATEQGAQPTDDACELSNSSSSTDATDDASTSSTEPSALHPTSSSSEAGEMARVALAAACAQEDALEELRARQPVPLQMSAQSPALAAGTRIALEASVAASSGQPVTFDPLLTPVQEASGGGPAADSTDAAVLGASALWKGAHAWRAPEGAETIFDEAQHPLGAGKRTSFGLPTVAEVSTFVRNVCVGTRMGAEANIVGLAYIERLLSTGKVQLGARTWRRVVLAAWLLAGKVRAQRCARASATPSARLLLPRASHRRPRAHAPCAPSLDRARARGTQMWDDDSFDNREFAQQFLLFEKDITDLEAAFLRAVGYDLSLSPSAYARYYFMLRALSQREAHEFPLRPLDERIAWRCAVSSKQQRLLFGDVMNSINLSASHVL